MIHNHYCITKVAGNRCSCHNKIDGPLVSCPLVSGPCEYLWHVAFFLQKRVVIAETVRHTLGRCHFSCVAHSKFTCASLNMCIAKWVG